MDSPSPTCVPKSGVDSGPLTVLYDGACPLCRREIDLYRALTPTAPLAFHDVSEAIGDVPEGTSRAQLLARFHVRHPDGRLESGAQAFLALWSRLPGWRWLAKLGRLPGMRWTMERSYSAFLYIRPQLQRMARAAERRKTGRLVAVMVATIPWLAMSFSAPVGAKPAFTSEATKTCVATAAAKSPSLSGYGVLECVGRSAQVCMARPGGDTTFGMIECLQGERDYWDGRLNTAYAKKMAAAKKEDASMTSIRATTASLAEAMRTMQRAWMSYRDAACLYEQAQWFGGTGGGPATMACHMHETARQALKLEGWWSQ